MTEAQEQGGAVQSAEEFVDRLDHECMALHHYDHDLGFDIEQAVDLIRERDAAIRRAAIESNAELSRHTRKVNGDCDECGTTWTGLGHVQVLLLEIMRLKRALAASGPSDSGGGADGEGEG